MDKNIRQAIALRLLDAQMGCMALSDEHLLELDSQLQLWSSRIKTELLDRAAAAQAEIEGA